MSQNDHEHTFWLNLAANCRPGQSTVRELMGLIWLLCHVLRYRRMMQVYAGIMVWILVTDSEAVMYAANLAGACPTPNSDLECALLIGGVQTVQAPGLINQSMLHLMHWQSL